MDQLKKKNLWFFEILTDHNFIEDAAEQEQNWINKDEYNKTRVLNFMRECNKDPKLPGMTKLEG